MFIYINKVLLKVGLYTQQVKTFKTLIIYIYSNLKPDFNPIGHTWYVLKNVIAQRKPLSKILQELKVTFFRKNVFCFHKYLLQHSKT